MQMTLYGIRSCDTVRKARAWLAAAGIGHRFHDFRADGLAPALLASWCAALGWETLLNRAGTTFRKLPDAEKAQLDAARARALMLAHPATIKRPVLAYPGGLLVGFAPERYAAALQGRAE